MSGVLIKEGNVEAQRHTGDNAMWRRRQRLEWFIFNINQRTLWIAGTPKLRKKHGPDSHSEPPRGFCCDSITASLRGCREDEHYSSYGRSCSVRHSSSPSISSSVRLKTFSSFDCTDKETEVWQVMTWLKETGELGPLQQKLGRNVGSGALELCYFSLNMASFPHLGAQSRGQ